MTVSLLNSACGMSDVTSATLARRSDSTTAHLGAHQIAPKLTTLQSRLLDAFRLIESPATANGAAKVAADRHGGLAESYRKRTRELVQSGSLEIVGTAVCAVTGKVARTYRVAGIGVSQWNQ